MSSEPGDQRRAGADPDVTEDLGQSRPRFAGKGTGATLAAAGAAGAPATSDAEAAREERLLAAVREYTAAVESGRRPNTREWLARYPDLAGELSACLGGLAFVNQAAAEICGTPGPGVGSGVGPRSAGAAGGAGADSAHQTLGDFRLLREVGRGGMGVVYEAEQLSLGRRVALKILPLAAALDPRHLQRFRNEAQAAAQLHHTNIVPVYGVGCERSVHYYAMQLIEGQSLAEVIRELRSPRDSNQSGLPVSPAPARPAAEHDSAGLSTLRSSKGSAYYRALARLGLQAAEALDYAHRAGVVHRDVKPANLLLDTRGNLWVTDFGLAQFYSDNGVTQTGDLVGTLRYMSPEQASGRAVILDQRTDVYSLGVTLYELITLERALPGETREQLLSQIGSHDPRPARSINRAIPAELETILAKATAKDPAERYASAGALADDLRRFLHDEPILARPPSALDQLVKWTRRHRSLAISGLVMLVLAAVGFLTSTVLIAAEQRKTRSAYIGESRKAREAARERVRAEQSFKQARDLVNYLSRVAADELADIPRSAEVRKEMLEAALDYYEGFLEERRGNSAVGAELAEAQSYVSRILTELLAFSDFYRADTNAKLLLEPAVQRELSLTADQLTKARAIRADGSGGGFPDDPSPGDPGEPGGEPPEKPEAVRPSEQKVAVETVLVKLAATQRAAWNRITGAPFTGTLVYRYGPRPDPGPGDRDGPRDRDGPGGRGPPDHGPQGPGGSRDDPFRPRDRGDIHDHGDRGPDRDRPARNGPGDHGGPDGAAPR